MDRKYTIIGAMCMLFLGAHAAPGSSSDRTSSSPASVHQAHQIAAIEAEIAAVEETGRVQRQAAEARAVGIRAEEVKAERIRELGAAGDRYDVLSVRMVGREISHITINQQGMPTYKTPTYYNKNGEPIKSRELTIFRGSVPLMTENGLKLATLLLPGISAPINDLREIMYFNDRKFITPKISVVLQDIPAYDSVSPEEMFTILLLLQMNSFRPCQEFVAGYPLEKGRYDDFTLVNDLVKYLRLKIGVVDTCYIETLIREAAEVAHRNGRSLNIGKSLLEGLLRQLSLRFYPAFFPAIMSESHSRSIGRSNKEYIERLQEFNAFEDSDDLNFLFVPEPERFVNLIRPTPDPAPVSGECNIL